MTDLIRKDIFLVSEQQDHYFFIQKTLVINGLKQIDSKSSHTSNVVTYVRTMP